MFVFLAHAGCSLNWSRFGVSVFFCLSGFLLVCTSGNEDTMKRGGVVAEVKNNIRYSYEKIKKLYPLHLVTMFLALLIPVLMFIVKKEAVNSIKELVIAFFANLFLVQTWIPSMEINIALNGVAWYLSVSAFLYFCFPWIFRGIRKIKKEWVLYVISAGILIMQILFSMLFLRLTNVAGTTWVWATYFFPLFRLGDFVIGANACIFYQRHLKDQKRNGILASILEIVALFLLIGYEWYREKATGGSLLSVSLINWTTLYIPISVIWIILFTKKQGILTTLCTNFVTVWLGNISGYMFLIHFVVTQYVGNALNFCDITLEKWQWGICYVVEFLLTVLGALLWARIAKRAKK